MNSIYNFEEINSKADLVGGFAFKSKCFKDVGIPVIKIANLKGKVAKILEKSFVDNNEFNDPKFNKYYLHDKDILIAMTGQGSIGRVSRLFLENAEKALLNQRVGKIICDEEKLNSNYLFYLLSSEYYQEHLFKLGSGSGQPNLSPKDILSVKIPCPDLETQRKIGFFYQLTEDKIRINEQINNNLESLARNIFKYWFIDFSPVHAKKLALEKGLSPAQAERAAMAIISGLCGHADFAENFEEMDKKLSEKLSKMSKEKQEELAHTASLFPSEFEDCELGEIPLGWKYSTVAAFGEVVTGKTPSTKQPEFYDGNLPFVTPSDFDSYGMHAFYARRTISDIGAEKFKNKILPSNSILVTCIGSDMGKVTILKEPSITNQQINSVKLNDDVDSLFLYFYFKSIYDHLRLLASDGTTMPIINKGLFEKIKVISPNKDIIKKFNNTANSMSDKILNAVRENLTLSLLRDTLLPRLLAGEIDLSQINITENE